MPNLTPDQPTEIRDDVLIDRPDASFAIRFDNLPVRVSPGGVLVPWTRDEIMLDALTDV